jgi:cationic peptide transport system permease protein
MDYLIMSIALTALSVPAFWIALIMTTLPNSMGLSLPIDGLISPVYDVPLVTGFTLIDSLLAYDLYQYNAFTNRLEHLVLPATVLAFFFITELIRATRHSVAMIMKKNYIKAAYSKGLRTITIVIQHVLRNAYPAILNQFKLQLSTIFSFAMTIDIVFSSQGMGHWLLLSIKASDYIALPTAMLIISGFILITSITLDIVLVLISPIKRMSLYADK